MAAFVTIDPAEIEVGDAIKKELFDKIKNNEDNLDERMTVQEISKKKINFIQFDVRNGARFSTATNVYMYEAQEDFTITSAFIRIFLKGSLSGALEIDIKKSITDLADGSFTTIFTTKPKITYSTASDYDASINQVFNSGQVSVQKGDYLRLDFTEMPSGGVISRFLINAYGE